MPAIKPRYDPPLGYPSRIPALIIRHPHYANYNTLVKLPALDERDVVDYNVALIICGIISDNSWNSGWFARSKDGTNVCEPGVPLTADVDVFYFVNNQMCMFSYHCCSAPLTIFPTDKYPVYISWDHWRLPSSHVDLPSAFSTLSIDPPSPSLRNGGYMEDLKSRDQSCRVSGIIDFCEQAHLVPAGEREWWDSNMGESSDLEIQSALNGMLLRTDLHRSFDTGTWVPMVREGGELVLYVIRTAEVSNQFVELWHNREMQRLVGIDRRCLFARVAWAVLSLHHEFLAIRRLASDNLLVRMKDGELKEMAPEVFKQFSRSRSRNPSPTKRPRLQALEEDGGIIVTAELRWCDEDLNESGNQRQHDSDDHLVTCKRGRKPLRSPAPRSTTHSRAKKQIKRPTAVRNDMLSYSLALTT
jgi:HNH endonuclease